MFRLLIVRPLNNTDNVGVSVGTTPTVATTAVSSITANSASSGGNVTSEGSASVTARGVCWSISANPTTSDSHTSDGTGTGSFTSSITWLSPGTTYHVRAYATNSVGTGYGSDHFFTTYNAPPPAPDIKANDADSPVIISPSDPVSITISLNPGGYADHIADWWIAVHTPFDPPGDWYAYVYPTGWQQGLNLCAQTPLISLSPFEVLNMSLPLGNYTFYFAVDPPDGSPVGPWWGMDSVEVQVQ